MAAIFNPKWLKTMMLKIVEGHDAYIREGDDLYAKYDELRVSPTGMKFFYKGEEVAETYSDLSHLNGTVSVQGLEGRAKIEF